MTIINPSVLGQEGSESVVYEVNKTYTVSTSGSGTVRDLEVQFYLLDNWKGWTEQEILSESVSTARGSVSIKSNHENRYAVVDFPELEGETETNISVTQVVKVTSTDLKIQPEDVKGNIPGELEKKFTTPIDHLWQSDDPDIEAKAQELTADLNNYYYKAKSILEWVENHFSYEVQNSEHSALWGFEHTEADCSEYSNLFIALARASGIPAKTVSGYLPFTSLYETEGNNLRDSGHQWVIIYLPSVGWTPVDLTYNIPKGQFGELSNDHITELVSDGSNWVSEGEISVPTLSYPSGSCVTTKRNQSCDLSTERSSKVWRRVAVEPDINVSSGFGEKDLRYTVEVSNDGSRKITNVKVRLELDNRFSPSSSEKTLESINSGLKKQIHFDVGVEGSVENSQGEAVISYKAGDYGSFFTREKTMVTFRDESQSYEVPKLPLPLEDLAIISVIIIGLIIGVSVLLRR